MRERKRWLSFAEAVFIVSTMLLVSFSSVRVIHASPSSVTVDFKVYLDTYLDAGNPTSSFGGSTSLYVGFFDAFLTNESIIFISFDTSGIKDATVSSVVLNLDCLSVSFVGSRSLTINRVDAFWLDNMTWNTQVANSGAGIIVSESDALGWKSFDVSSIYKASDHFALEIADASPVAAAIAQYRSGNGLISERPYLEVQFTYNYHYNLVGAYYENGVVFGKYNVTALFQSSSLTFQISPPNETVYFNDEPVSFGWNIGSTQRIIQVGSPSETIHILIPSSSYSVYGFLIYDYASIINNTSVLTTYQYVNGSLVVVERKDAHFISNQVYFVMQVGSSYLLTLENTTGGISVYSFGWFTAGSVMSENLAVYTVNYDPTLKLVYKYVICDAERPSNTVIVVNYDDTLAQTLGVHLYVCYRNGTIAYTDFSTANSVSFIWMGADNMTDYMVYLQIDHASIGTLTYSKSLAYQPVPPANPFDLSMLGNFPIPADQVVSVAIILCVFGVFSVLTAPLGLLLGSFALPC